MQYNLVNSKEFERLKGITVYYFWQNPPFLVSKLKEIEYNTKNKVLKKT